MREERAEEEARSSQVDEIITRNTNTLEEKKEALEKLIIQNNINQMDISILSFSVHEVVSRMDFELQRFHKESSAIHFSAHRIYSELSSKRYLEKDNDNITNKFSLIDVEQIETYKTKWKEQQSFRELHFSFEEDDLIEAVGREELRNKLIKDYLENGNNVIYDKTLDIDLTPNLIEPSDTQSTRPIDFQESYYAAISSSQAPWYHEYKRRRIDVQSVSKINRGYDFFPDSSEDTRE